MIRHCSLRDADLAAVQNLVINTVWQRQNWDEGLAKRYVNWRFVERQEGDTIVAFDGDRCVAMLDCFMREYVVNGSVMVVAEPCDWFCLPEYRGSQLGLGLLHRAMNEHDHLIVVGGSDMTRKILPRMGWQTLSSVPTYTHVVGFGRTIPRVASSLRMERSLRMAGRLGFERTLSAAGVTRAFAGRRSRYLREFSGRSSYEVVLASEGVDPPRPDLSRNEPGIQNLVGSSDALWLSKVPVINEGTGFRWLSFLQNGEQVGVSLVRTYDTETSKEAKILHLQTASEDTDLRTSIIGETTRHLVEQGASLISARFSCSLIDRDLRREGYLRGEALPAFWWSKETEVLGGRVRLSGVRGDDMLLPMEA